MPDGQHQPDQAQLHAIVEGLSDGVILMDPDGRIVWANDAALRMHGCTELQELGGTATGYRNRFDLQLRNGQPMAASAYPLARLCRGETFEDVIVDVRKAHQREPDWVHRDRGLVLNRDGKPDCLVLILCDATEAYEAEERFESMFNANPAPALIVRLADLRYVRVNEGFLDLSGWDRDQIIGRSLYEVDILGQAAEKDKAKALLANGETIPQMEADLPLPDGDSKLVLLAGHPAEMPNNEPCMIFTFADLEPRRRAEMALRQSEERFATAFRFAPVPMLLTSLDGHRILNVNHAFLALTDWGHDSVVGRKPAEIELFESSATRREIEKKVSESGSFRGYELQVKTRTGALVTCLASAETVSINGQYCILAAFQDISDRKRTELDLIAAIEAAMQDSSWLSQKIMDRLAALRDPSPSGKAALPIVSLTAREREVLGLITQGKTDDAIAEALSLKRNTIRNHVARLYAKINAHSRAEAIIWARDRGHQLGFDPHH
ncbi:helix-turn-helix transcriptional regulator [Sphingomonas immobilis]|uniref:Helix-turn-helix transcriptional regulator n=1 Tax=Sphingomonas immobilis TaxID=3063997 RepID=A0ABT8ZWH6_9SPHN|nr:helix-turn-helix transcriptional regulator [Sphingomonas sp. CA1-15]MDO7841928.1 helix-turn-helix transcriptional regulator [Sphingomonas sp. CA1-15]